MILLFYYFFLYTVSSVPADVTFTITSTSSASISFPSSSTSGLYFVIDFTFTLTVPFFISANLFTVITILLPSSTVFPTSKLCFNTTPLDFFVSSSYAIETSNPCFC